MANANGHGGHGTSKTKVTSLRDMPQAVQPPRDLWAGIEARINAERHPAAQGSSAPPRMARLRWLAAAAMIGTLAVGIWIGRSVAPTVGPVTHPTIQNDAGFVQAAYLADPKFREQRKVLLESLQAKLNALPPDSRAKVVSSLETIHKSMQDLEAALGKDPTNALLQELLLNTYQDEMRVMTTVSEASDTGKGI